MRLECSSAVFVYPRGFIYSRAPDTLGRWTGWKWLVLVRGAAQRCQSLPWKHMAERQARWATILTWHWLTHVGRGRCDEEGKRGHPSTRLCHRKSSPWPHLPSASPSDGQETSATMPPPNPTLPPPYPPRARQAWAAATVPPVQNLEKHTENKQYQPQHCRSPPGQLNQGLSTIYYTWPFEWLMRKQSHQMCTKPCLRHETGGCKLETPNGVTRARGAAWWGLDLNPFESLMVLLWLK